MPELVNHTPYPNFRYYSQDNQGQEFGVIITKATYELAPSGRLLLAEEQAPMVFTDLCHGAVNVTSLWHPSDMVPHKPATDIIVNGVARVPGGQPVPSWLCGVKIEDGSKLVLEKVLRVTGPRQWQPRWKRTLNDEERKAWRNHRQQFEGWDLSEPDPVAELPLHYEYAFGGEVPQGLDDDGNPRFDTDHRNPLGRSKIDPEWTDHTRPVPAPQIEAFNDPISDPYAKPAPQSLGPIPPAWLPRRPLGGTYDQNWKDNLWPAWPPDYDFAYHNSAHPDLTVKPWLKGSERIFLSGLAAWAKIVAFDLPGERIAIDFVEEDGAVVSKDMVLDTVFLDIGGPNRRDWRIYLTWRVNFEPDRYERANLYPIRSTSAGQSQRPELVTLHE
ncbi:DUF2169 family type VI secretion system accessory protein [Mesorhizobium retamae]|uniref:DUF2169 domain-containing protein n=1 Tax=Mesorhizobium retamae TaxID=2912854 RepID=A0ABS9QP69_9HYPH|nr:DUF2169 domain-containing protein [Mesorhizobium sp. IRAMC:0171]MCG7509245.1 DUF2169 domain-containing protein [Mesorhizobium sp. IRAMC:0171]